MKYIPLNDLSRLPASLDRIKESINAVIDSGWWLKGENEKEFTREFSEFLSVKFGLCVANGTDALEIALQSLIKNPSPSDEVITVANAGGYTTTACRKLNLKPVYVDINVDDQLMSFESLQGALSPNVKAIVVTHLYGGCVDVISMKVLLNELGYGHIPVLEDCAQAHGGRVNGYPVGSMGEISTFSFYPTKNLGAMADGGFIATNSQDLYDRARTLHQYGWSSKYHIDTPYGRNSRIDEMQASVLRCLLPGLEEANKRRMDIISSYKAVTGNKLSFLSYRSNTNPVGHLAIALLRNSGERDDFQNHMKTHSIQTDVHYPILDCEQKGWKGLPSRIGCPQDLRNSKQSAERLVTVPVFPGMTTEEVERVKSALASWELG